MADIKRIIDVSNLELKVLPTQDIQATISTTEINHQKSNLTTTKLPKVLESKALTTKNIQDIKCVDRSKSLLKIHLKRMTAF